jgi:hypothetical protein
MAIHRQLNEAAEEIEMVPARPPALLPMMVGPPVAEHRPDDDHDDDDSGDDHNDDAATTTTTSSATIYSLYARTHARSRVRCINLALPNLH